MGLTLASLLAGFATTPYAAFHFHRLAPYGVLANLLAMPVVSAWVMPMGILGVVAMPFGFDAECWRQMGYGIEWMDAVSLWVASLPALMGRIDLFGTGTLLLATAGLLVMGLLKTPLRWSGALLVLLGVIVLAEKSRRRTCWSPRTAAPSRCAAPTAGSPSTIREATRLRSTNGSRPMPTTATSRIADWVQGILLRSCRLRRQACRRRTGRLCARTRCVRGGLAPRRACRRAA